ncbi:MAG: VWA domain-containing protein, partial [Clostridia bacterium]|nr:VWA domain-containing protein [Clostridia bacterium]
MKKKDKKLLKVLLVFFVVFSMLLNNVAPVLAATIDATSELGQNIEENKKEDKDEASAESEVVDNATEDSNEVKTETEVKLESKSEEQDETFAVSTNVEETAAETLKVISKLNTEYTSNDGNTYEVTLTYGKDTNIPENAKLKVEEFAKDTDEYKNAREAVLTDKEEKGETTDLDSFDMVALDISIIDANGNEIEPDVSVSVEINIKSLQGVEDLSKVVDSVEIQHHVEEQGKTTIDYVEDNDKYNTYKKSIETKFDVDSFSTFTISWNNYGTRKTTVHYGYMENGEFKEFASDPTPEDVTTSHYAYLIYDFDGYHYSGNTYYRANESTNPSSNGGTKIQAMLRHNNNNWQYHGTNNNNWSNVANNSHIYVIYEANPAITQGGTPTPKQNTEDPHEPEILKESDDNEDGTRTLSLSVTGYTKALEVEKLADVIVVFDVSGSMNYDMDGDTTYNDNNRRLNIAKTAVKNMAKTLSSKTNSNGDKLIRMGLISFSNTAQVEQGLTDSYGNDTYSGRTDFEKAVNGLTAGGGTNWEQALKLANEMQVDSGRATFVIFVSDGDPTFRISRMNATDAQLDILNKDDATSWNYSNNQFYLSNNLFGTGSTDPSSYNYNAALKQAQAIVGAKKNFYTIGISNDVTNMSNLNTAAGGKGNYTATSSSQLESAFNDIIAKMEGTLGYNAGIIDGVTGLTNLTAKTPIVGVDENSFTYYRKTAEETDFSEWDPTEHGANNAVYNQNTGAVEWDFGDGFQLEDGVTYKVSFLVWPSQTAIDYVTDLNNGLIEYDSLPEDVRKQISESPENSGNYVLKTNTDEAYVKYQLSTKMDGKITITGEEQKKYFDDVDPLKLDTMKLKFEKIFTDTLTDGEDRDHYVVLNVKYREVKGDGTTGEWKDYNAFQDFTYTTNSNDEITTVDYKVDGEGNPIYSNRIILYNENDWKADCFISPGLETVHGNETVVYNPGYEFMLEEPDIDYHYELNSEIVKPMLVNLEKKYLNSDGSEGDEFLTAENIVKGGIDVKKILTDQDGNEIKDNNVTFTIKGKIVDKDGHPYTFNNAEWDTRTDKSTGEGAPEIWKQHQNDTGAYHFYDADGNRTGYKLHFDSTDNIVLELKAGERVRFVNVPKDSRFEFYEDTGALEDGYKFVKIEGENTTVPATTEVENQPTVKDGKVTGDVYGNVNHNITVTNKIAYVEATFAGIKDIDNRDMTENDIFTFEVVNNADASEKWEVTNDATGKINYPTIRYTETGTYTYTVRETSKGGSGITPDTRTYTVTVNVTEENGKLVAKLSENATNLDFMNMYDAKGSVTFEGTKSLEGRSLTANDVFTFEISEGENTWTATSDATGKINYPKISYTIADLGMHKYTVKETSTDGKGITVDTNTYEVTVAVTDNGDGTLKVIESDNSKALNFVNTYEAEGKATFGGTKSLEGRTLTENDVFTFEVKEGNEVVATGTNDASGKITYTDINYTLADVGTHTYTVK